MDWSGIDTGLEGDEGLSSGKRWYQMSDSCLFLKLGLESILDIGIRADRSTKDHQAVAHDLDTIEGGDFSDAEELGLGQVDGKADLGEASLQRPDGGTKLGVSTR